MKRLFPIFITLSMIFMTGCKNTELIEGFTDDGKLAVRVNVLSASLSGTKGNAGGGTIYGDTTFIDEDVYVTAQQDVVMPPNRGTKGTPAVSAAEIKELTTNLYVLASGNYVDGTTPLNRSVQFRFENGGFGSDNSLTILSTTNVNTLLAYSPIISATNGLAVAGTRSEKIKYSVPEDVTKQPDFCIADVNNNLNFKNTDGKGHLRTLNMYHALTAVGFSIRGNGAKIKSATVTGFYRTGVFDIHAKTDSDGVITIKSTPSEMYNTPIAAGIEDKFYSVAWTAPWVNCTKTDGYLMMVPQTLTSDAKLTVVYTYNTGTEAGKELTFTTRLDKLIPEWKSGTKVTYNIRLKTAPVVAASTVVNIPVFKAGYTGDVLPFTGLAADDNLTFTWDASWLRIHRGAPKKGDLSGGASSGWSTGVGGTTNNIYFYSTNDNRSSIKRTAKVTVRGTKSQEVTFLVTQMMLPTLTVSKLNVNVHDYKPRAWEPGFVQMQSYTTNYLDARPVFSGYPDWCRPSTTYTTNSFSGNIVCNLDWNRQANINRSCTFTMGIKIGDEVFAEQQITVTQKASQFWLVTNGGGGLYFAIFREDAGRFSGRQNWQCYGRGQGDRPASGSEMYQVVGTIRSGVWPAALSNNAYLSTNQGYSQYWTCDEGSSYWGVSRNYYVRIAGWGSNIHIDKDEKETLSGYRYYRCVYTDPAKLY